MDSELEFEIRRIIMEMKSGHNDGWISSHYRDILIRLKKLIDEALDDAKKR